MQLHQEFSVYPAIDLRRGEVVRLYQGDPKHTTSYGDNPAEFARRWLDFGARWLHVVNLDGAFNESGVENMDALVQILEVSAKHDPPGNVQFGGGIRSLQDVERIISLGVSRVILGSMAVESPEASGKALAQFGPDQIALSVDVRKGTVHIQGWKRQSQIDPLEMGQEFFNRGLRWCVYTEISRDGAGKGLDLNGASHFARATGLAIIAAGGVASINDVRQARKGGLSGVIIGRALYEGQVDLKEALKC